jgi:hypothetical protein
MIIYNSPLLTDFLSLITVFGSRYLKLMDHSPLWERKNGTSKDSVKYRHKYKPMHPKKNQMHCHRTTMALAEKNPYEADFTVGSSEDSIFPLRQSMTQSMTGLGRCLATDPNDARSLSNFGSTPCFNGERISGSVSC